MDVETALRMSLEANAIGLYQAHGGHSPGTDLIRDLARSLEARGVQAKDPTPAWKQTVVHGRSDEALAIAVRPGSVVTTSEGQYVFEKAGEWILLPVPVWRRTLERVRQTEARITGKGDGGRRLT